MQGDIIHEDKGIESFYCRNQPQSDGTFKRCDSVIQVYDGLNAEAPPLKPYSRTHTLLSAQDNANILVAGIRNHVVLTANTSAIPASSLQKMIGTDNIQYYRIHVEIRIKFSSAHTEYSLWSAGKCYGKVEAKYE